MQLRAFVKRIFRWIFHPLEARAVVGLAAALVAEVDTWVAVGLLRKEVYEGENDDVYCWVVAVCCNSLLVWSLALLFQSVLVI